MKDIKIKNCDLVKKPDGNVYIICDDYLSKEYFTDICFIERSSLNDVTKLISYIENNLSNLIRNESYQYLRNLVVDDICKQSGLEKNNVSNILCYLGY